MQKCVSADADRSRMDRSNRRHTRHRYRRHHVQFNEIITTYPPSHEINHQNPNQMTPPPTFAYLTGDLGKGVTLIVDRQKIAECRNQTINLRPVVAAYDLILCLQLDVSAVEQDSPLSDHPLCKRLRQFERRTTTNVRFCST